MICVEDITDICVGRIGEHLVCADILAQGYNAFMVEHGTHYDIVMDYKDKLFRVQVKTTKTNKQIPNRKAHTPAYLFNIRRCGVGGRHSYLDNDIDLIALVALDSLTIGYLPFTSVKQSMVFRIDSYRGKYYDELLNKKDQQIKQLMLENKYTQKEISEKVGVSEFYITKTKRKGFKHNNCGCYLSDLKLKLALEVIK